MKRLLFLLFSLVQGVFTSCQNPPPGTDKMVRNPAFHNELNRLLDFTVPLISVTTLADQMGEVVLLDAREPKEFDVSHIPGAIYVGYHKFDRSRVADIPKDRPIVVYCSVGYRSSKIGKKLQKMGYTHVRNLYGSIFEWANQGLPLEDSEGNPIQKVHTYDRNWSRWVTSPEVEKVW